MSLSELSATAEVSRGGYRSPDRRGAGQPAAAPEPIPAPPPAAETAADAFPLDVAYYASRFRTDLSQLKTPAEPDRQGADGGETHGDLDLFDFFGNLSVLLLAVRSGDLSRAQAAADALEMDVLVERSAGRRHGETATLLGDLGRLFGAAQSHDEPAARAAAKDLADEFRTALAPPPPPLPAPPREPFAEPKPEAGVAAYDTLAHYFDDEPGAA